LSPVLAKVIIQSSALSKEVADPDILEQGTLKYPDASVIDPVIVNRAKSSAFKRLETLK
jgi:hypothetical protein